MKNILRIFWRDLGRALRNPAVLIVLAALVVLPSLYTWFNVAGFWDPYGNTGNLRVCVVNEDEGTEDETLGELNVGDQVVEQLKGNTQLGWAFMGRDEALEEVRSGEAYAAIVIPADFSRKLASLLGKKVERANIEYYVNEKKNAVAPKITDAGSTTLDSTINGSFVSTASEAVAKVVDEKLKDAKSGIDGAKRSALQKVDAAEDGVADARRTMKRLRAASDSGVEKAGDARQELRAMRSDLSELSGRFDRVPGLVGSASERLLAYGSSAGRLADRGSSLLSRSSASASSGILAVSGEVTRATSAVDAALTRADALLSENRELIDGIGELEDAVTLPALKQRLSEARASLESQNERIQGAVDDLQGISRDLRSASRSTSKAASDVNSSVQSALRAASRARSELTGTLVPEAGSALARMTALSSSLSAAEARWDAAFEQADAVLGQLETTLSSTGESLASTDSTLASLGKSLGNAKTDLSAISASRLVKQVLGQGSISPSKIAAFMKSPTLIETEELYPLNAYGSGMAPLFINLTLWIGVFMLMVILRLEVDDEGVGNATSTQRYFGRWLLIAALVVFQAAVCCAGCLVMGVETASTALFFVTAIAASLTYLSIQYMLSTTLQHIGKGLCVMLVFLQIPGATGLYPVELTNSFFRSVYDFLPFTYGIGAMRETIAGFYDGVWGHDLAILGVYFLVFLVLGAVLRKRSINLNRMFARQLKESDLFNIESVEMPEQRYRNRELVRAFTGKEEYRIILDDRYRQFMARYPRLKLGALVAGIGAPVVLTTVFSLLGFSRVWLLTTWLIWVIVLMLFLVVVEFMRDQLERQRKLEGLSTSELADVYVNRDKIGKSDATPRSPVARDGRGGDGGAR